MTCSGYRNTILNSALMQSYMAEKYTVYLASGRQHDGLWYCSCGEPFVTEVARDRHQETCSE